MASNCTRMIEVGSLQFADNVRTPECMAIPAMVESLTRHGFKVNHPLVVSEKPNGTYLVLVGNRRGLGLQWLAENDKEVYNRALPGGKVPAVVHKGLTTDEEIELRIDHSTDEDRVPLDEWSIFLAISQLLKAGIDTQERIAIKLGLFKLRGKEKGKPQREYVQVRTALARLPDFVQKEYRKLTLDKDDTPVRWTKVLSLYKTYNEEYVTHPDGDGPKFKAYWQKIMTPPKMEEEVADGQREPKELSAAEAVKRSQSASSTGLRQALLAATRQSATDLSEIDASMVAAESALRTLKDIKDYMGEKDFAELIGLAAKHAREREDVKVEPVHDKVEA